MKGDDWILAIDYGTTWSAAAMWRGGNVDLVHVNGRPMFPSAVYVDEDSRLVVGETVANLAVLAPERFDSCPKRRLGLPGATEPVDPVAAAAAVISVLAAEAQATHDGHPPSRVVATCPAKWAEGGPKRRALSEAVISAGLPAPALVKEPVAAATYLGHEPNHKQGDQVAVYDLGGGTLDTTVLVRTASSFRVVGAPGGEDHFGGEDFDEAVYQALGAQLPPGVWAEYQAGETGQARRANYKLRYELARQVKEALGRGDPAGHAVIEERGLMLRAEDFEKLIKPMVDKSIDVLESTLRDAGVDASTLAGLYLVGGSSRIPLITRLVFERLDRYPHTKGDRKLVVCQGAAALGDDVDTIPEKPPIDASGFTTWACGKCSADNIVPARSFGMRCHSCSTTFNFMRCAYCQKLARLDPTQPGNAFACPACKKTNRILLNVEGPDFVFQCTCLTWMTASPGSNGGHCPQCGTDWVASRCHSCDAATFIPLRSIPFSTVCGQCGEALTFMAARLSASKRVDAKSIFVAGAPVIYEKGAQTGPDQTQDDKAQNKAGDAKAGDAKAGDARAGDDKGPPRLGRAFLARLGSRPIAAGTTHQVKGSIEVVTPAGPSVIAHSSFFGGKLQKRAQVDVDSLKKVAGYSQTSFGMNPACPQAAAGDVMDLRYTVGPGSPFNESPNVPYLRRILVRAHRAFTLIGVADLEWLVDLFQIGYQAPPALRTKSFNLAMSVPLPAGCYAIERLAYSPPKPSNNTKPALQQLTVLSRTPDGGAAEWLKATEAAAQKSAGKDVVVEEEIKFCGGVAGRLIGFGTKSTAPTVVFCRGSNADRAFALTITNPVSMSAARNHLDWCRFQ